MLKDEHLEYPFDAVLMLTWSDWKTEPRSNRYHYATRFARLVPVLFLQHRYEQIDAIHVEPSETGNMEIVHVSCGIPVGQVEQLKRLLWARGIRRPLLWIYDSMNYGRLIEAIPLAFRVYHATEDYLLESSGWSLNTQKIARAVLKLLPSVDYLVACTEGVAESCLARGKYEGPYAVVENGCDARFFLDLQAQAGLPEVAARPGAIFQGGINQRLDYDLLLSLVRRMADWDFHFCGRVASNEGWRKLSAERNVFYHGELEAEGIGAHMCRATVGLIPFIQDQWIRNSWPLKAYEYVACGLPVVSVPIDALTREPSLFAIARTVDEFEKSMRDQAATRCDAVALEARKQAALKNSYDIRFETMVEGLVAANSRSHGSPARARIAMLYDGMGSMHVSTIREHLAAFEKYSRHEITFVSATSAFWQRDPDVLAPLIDFSVFDALVVHYSVRTSVRGHLDEGLARAVAGFGGLKVLLIQDEYDNVEVSRQLIERLGFDVVYTCVPPDGLDYVYPAYRFPSTEFLPTLTGYVPEDPDIEKHALPLRERKVSIAYRGRQLPWIYGELGYEKFRIGVEMKRFANAHGILVDIEVDDSRRIYGADWYRFLGSARSTLGTESGSNVFDIDGTLQAQIDAHLKANPARPAREVVAELLAPLEGRIRMNQISPKIFEAIRLRTALILFEGEYSGVVQADVHFIPLKKDFSNVDEVFRRLADDAFIEAMAERAYSDVVLSGKYAYRSFVAGVDRDIDNRVHRRVARHVLRGPWLLAGHDGTVREALPSLPVGLCAGPHPLGRPPSLRELALKSGVLTQSTPFVTLPMKSVAAVQEFATTSALRAWRLLPIDMKERFLDSACGLREGCRVVVNPASVHYRLARRLWRLLPQGARNRLAGLLARLARPRVQS